METDQIYFCSFTCLAWIPLIEITNLYDEIYRWLNILIKDNHQVIGFVVMPNHLHVLIYLKSGGKSINTILANGKRFLAYEIVKRLEELKKHEILDLLANAVTANERKRNKKHRVFESSSDIKPCNTERFTRQKLEYIHANPVRGKWNLAHSFIDYAHSSARFYEENIPHQYVKLTHYKDVG
jgi:REP element-mobilizing transposase RayT